MNKLSAQQTLQENRYEFPYHYIPFWDGNNFSQTRSLNWGYEYLSYLFFVLDKVVGIGFESLLDVGCGDGRFLFELRRHATEKKLVGIDYSQRAIEYAKIMGNEIEWIHGDIKEKGLLGRKFDIITLIETLEHVPPGEINDFFMGIAHHLKERGNLIITVPSKNISVIKKHYQHFDLESLTRSISPFFKVVHVYYLNKDSSFSLKLIKKILSNRFFTLNSKLILRLIYKYYINNLLVADNSNCRRIVLVCKKDGGIP